MSNDYPRDLVGYGANPPHPEWPDEAAIAVQFVINYEEGGENSILHGDAGSEAFLSEIIGADWFPARLMSQEYIYEYGSRAGFWRLHRIVHERNLPVTVYGVAMALQRNPDAVAAMKAARGRSLRMVYAGLITKTSISRLNANICARPSRFTRKRRVNGARLVYRTDKPEHSQAGG